MRAPDPRPAATPPAGLELAFVLAPRQNLYFVELAEALCDEVMSAGVPAGVHVGNFPPPRPGLIYVLTTPHEYFTLLNGRHGPLPEVLARTIFICAEQPDTPFFDNNVSLARAGGATFDINGRAVRRFRSEGVPAQLLGLGWTPRWDRGDETERDIDIAFLGTLTARRGRILGEMAPMLTRHRVRLVLGDNSHLYWSDAGGFLHGEARRDVLSRTKVVVNIHREGNRDLEWLRVAQAVSCGAAVVTETAVGCGPLVPGVHLLSGEPDSLGPMCSLLLQDPERRAQMSDAAYDLLRIQRPLGLAATSLVAAAGRLTPVAPQPDPDHRFFTQPQPDPAMLPVVSVPFAPASGEAGEGARVRRALKDVRLELIQVRRAHETLRLLTTTGEPPPRIEVVERSDAWISATARISVITALYNHAEHIIAALSSVAEARDGGVEAIVVDDGSTDESSEMVLRWIADHQNIPTLLLRHPVNQGLARTRNDALALARGARCFVLDADNAIYPHALSRLDAALDDDPGAAFAYGILEIFSGEQTLGLSNGLPWEPERLRAGNYIDAMALMRTAVVRRHGGYATDPRLHGWEDYALWCAMASAGHRAAFVPEIVARYRSEADSMLALTDLSATDAFSVIVDANPELMRGIDPPG